MSVISFILISLMILTFYYEYNKENSLNTVAQNFIAFIKEPNIRKILGLNSLFLIILMNFPLYYIWVYFRKNNFFPYEFFEYIYIIKTIGIENIFVSMIVILYLFLPYSLKFIQDKNGNEDRTTKCFLIIAISLIYLTFLFLFIEGILSNFYTTISYLLFFISISLQVLLRVQGNSSQIKNWWISIISIFILIILPFCFNQAMIKRTLFNNNIGNFEVAVINNNGEIRESCLLLKTENLYYLQDKKDREIYIINSERIDLKYKTNKKYCEISVND